MDVNASEAAVVVDSPAAVMRKALAGNVVPGPLLWVEDIAGQRLRSLASGHDAVLTPSRHPIDRVCDISLTQATMALIEAFSPGNMRWLLDTLAQQRREHPQSIPALTEEERVMAQALANQGTTHHWLWWTSNSMRRLSAEETHGDGDVLYGAWDHEMQRLEIRGTAATKDYLAQLWPQRLRVLVEMLP